MLGNFTIRACGLLGNWRTCVRGAHILYMCAMMKDGHWRNGRKSLPHHAFQMNFISPHAVTFSGAILVVRRIYIFLECFNGGTGFLRYKIEKQKKWKVWAKYWCYVTHCCYCIIIFLYVSAYRYTTGVCDPHPRRHGTNILYYYAHTLPESFFVLQNCQGL